MKADRLGDYLAACIPAAAAFVVFYGSVQLVTWGHGNEVFTHPHHSFLIRVVPIIGVFSFLFWWHMAAHFAPTKQGWYAARIQWYVVTFWLLAASVGAMVLVERHAAEIVTYAISGALAWTLAVNKIVSFMQIMPSIVSDQQRKGML